MKNTAGLQYPILYFLDEHYSDVKVGYRFKGRETMDFWLNLLEEHGVGKGKSAPEFTPEIFPQTYHCLAWRAEGTDGSRSHLLYPYDLSCHNYVRKPHPGNCECRDGSSVRVEYSPKGNREPFTCEDKCRDSGAAAVMDDEEL